MFSSLHVKGFRCFEDLSVEGLRRVNLFVGKNNAGKTALLEAVELLARGPNVEALAEQLHRRREFGPPRSAGGDDSLLDVAQLFFGRKLAVGSRLVIAGRTGADEATGPASPALREFVCDVPDRGEWDALVRSNPGLLEAIKGGVGLLHRVVVRMSAGKRWTIAPLRGRSLPVDQEELFSPWESGDASMPAAFVGPYAALEQDLSAAWDRLLLTRGEETVLEALRVVEPGVRRLAFLDVGEEDRVPFVALDGVSDRVPLGSVGEGVTRMLVLALAAGQLVAGQAGSGGPPASGVLLVDEIDTGLHHSVLVDLWEMVFRMARTSSFQVFATTHSRDCLQALAEVVLRTPELAGEVAVHRLRSGARRSTRFDAEALELVRSAGLEIR